MPKITPEKLEAMRSIGFINGPLPSKPRVREWVSESTGRVKATTDELGNTVTQHARGDRQDVHINATPVQAKAGLTPKG
jgi:hypothetical protein